MTICTFIGWLIAGIDMGVIIHVYLHFCLRGWDKPIRFSPWILKALGILSIIATLLLFVDIIVAKAECVPDTLCFRLNNPMCVTGSHSNPWEGQLAIKQQGLVKFDCLQNGLRAGAIVLTRYQTKHKINTLERLVTRYCTANREIYAKHLSKRLGVPRKAKIDISEKLPQLMQGIITMENGKCPWSVADLTEIINHKTKENNR